MMPERSPRVPLVFTVILVVVAFVILLAPAWAPMLLYYLVSKWGRP